MEASSCVYVCLNDLDVLSQHLQQLSSIPQHIRAEDSASLD